MFYWEEVNAFCSKPSFLVLLWGSVFTDGCYVDMGAGGLGN